MEKLLNIYLGGGKSFTVKKRNCAQEWIGNMGLPRVGESLPCPVFAGKKLVGYLGCWEGLELVKAWNNVERALLLQSQLIFRMPVMKYLLLAKTCVFSSVDSITIFLLYCTLVFLMYELLENLIQDTAFNSCDWEKHELPCSKTNL